MNVNYTGWMPSGFLKCRIMIIYDLILADPPFFKDDIHSAVKNFIERKYLTEDGIIIIERSIQTQKKDMESFGMEPFKRIGDSLIYLFEHSVDKYYMIFFQRSLSFQ